MPIITLPEFTKNQAVQLFTKYILLKNYIKNNNNESLQLRNKCSDYDDDSCVDCSNKHSFEHNVFGNVTKRISLNI